MDSWARREAKIRQNEQQMGEEDIFFNVCTQRKKQEVCRDGHGGQRGSFGGTEGKEEARGAIWI